MSRRRLIIADRALPESGGPISLTDSEWHYLVRVVRLPLGSALSVLDGQGRAWSATISGPATLQLDAVSDAMSDAEEPSERHVTLAFAPPKGKRLDFLLEKAAELGVDRLVPMITHRSVRKPDAKSVERWARIVLEGSRQSHSLTVPEIVAPVSYETALTACDGLGLIAAPGASHRLPEVLTHDQAAVWVFSGPEGGFTERELGQADDAGLTRISLGPRILRAETAPLVALTVIRHLGWLH